MTVGRGKYAGGRGGWTFCDPAYIWPWKKTCGLLVPPTGEVSVMAKMSRPSTDLPIDGSKRTNDGLVVASSLYHALSSS